MEEQAIDRVHRLTQTVDVVIYKITIANSVEERILALQEKKRELATQAIEGGKGAAGKLGMKEMLQLFRREAEHAPMERSDVGKYDAKKPRVLMESSRSSSVDGTGVQNSQSSLVIGSGGRDQARGPTGSIYGGAFYGNGNGERRVSPPKAFVPVNKLVSLPNSNGNSTPASTSLGKPKSQMIEDNVYGRRW